MQNFSFNMIVFSLCNAVSNSSDGNYRAFVQMMFQRTIPEVYSVGKCCLEATTFQHILHIDQKFILYAIVYEINCSFFPSEIEHSLCVSSYDLIFVIQIWFLLCVSIADFWLVCAMLGMFYLAVNLLCKKRCYQISCFVNLDIFFTFLWVMMWKYNVAFYKDNLFG